MTEAPPLDGEGLRDAVRRRLGRDDAEVGAPERVKRIGGQAHEGTIGVYRVAGVAHVAGDASPWSLVAKGMQPAGDPRLPAQVEREARAYAWEPLAHGRFRAARCFGSEQRDDGSRWVWIEDLTGAPGPPWDVWQFLAAAQALGSFHGEQLRSERAVEPWMGQPSLHGYCRAGEIGRLFEQLRKGAATPEARELLGLALPGDGLARVLEWWDHREDGIAAETARPSVLSHNDCHNGNLFVVGEGARAELVGVDWAYLGPAPLGSDCGCLAISDLLWLRQEPLAFRALHEETYEAWLHACELVAGPVDGVAARHGFLRYAGVNGCLRLAGGISRFVLEPGPAPPPMPARREIARRFGAAFAELVRLGLEAD